MSLLLWLFDFNPICGLNMDTVSWQPGGGERKGAFRGEMVPHRTIHHMLNHRWAGRVCQQHMFVCLCCVIRQCVSFCVPAGGPQRTEGTRVVQDAVRTVMGIHQYEQQFDG